jgi:hypothetical protein
MYPAFWVVFMKEKIALRKEEKAKNIFKEGKQKNENGKKNN